MRHKDVAKFYYVCSQSLVAMKEYKEGSNRKRMERFPCQGKMQMKIDMPAAEAMLEIHHGILHNRPTVTSEISEECKKEIDENLHCNPIHLRQILRTKNVMKNYTPRQIHSYWERAAGNKLPDLVSQFSVAQVIPSPVITTNIDSGFIIPTMAAIPYPSLPPMPIVSSTPNPTLQKSSSKELPKVGNRQFNHDEFAEYVTKMEQFAKRCRNQLDRQNYTWLDTVKILTAGVIEMENDIEELERQRASERGATKPWTIHYK
ncbi:12349_t:CDS:1 [Acaulospora colombiana]|uniref:12349_t:CDS:1 n=1 Tax=Acaulospora colombiana TaxID=27376 RepID=A0ACA9LGN9_9GLOM|nr:12349_t:CDS:1 [Acaulospora colombiana]